MGCVVSSNLVSETCVVLCQVTWCQRHVVLCYVRSPGVRDVLCCVMSGHLVSETVRVKRHYQERSLIATLEEQEPRPLDRFSLSIEPEM